MSETTTPAAPGTAPGDPLPSTEALAAAGLRLDVDGSVATVWLDRPEVRNAQTPRMWLTLAELGRALGGQETSGVRVVVLRGTGGTFSAGLDRRILSGEGVDGAEPITTWMDGTDAELVERIDGYQQGFTWLRRGDLVTVAVVEGHAVGAGFQLALSCDLRVLAEDARFAMLEPALGLVPDLTGTKPLVEAVGYARALEICATARTVGAAEAAALGLATVVVPNAEVDDAVTDLVAALTAHDAAAVSGTKRLLATASALSLDEQRLAERTEQVARFRALAALFGP